MFYQFYQLIMLYQTYFFDKLEFWVRWFVTLITNYLPVKVIRDEKGVPFLYRYHLFALTNDGPGICIHHFVKSDPDRGYHDHPWKRAVSLILCGGYEERIVEKTSDVGSNNTPQYTTYQRNRFTLNWLNGEDMYHRVMIPENGDAWTLFFFQKRRKTWGMLSLGGIYNAMSTSVSDLDGGWWNHVMH
jgi:hypothetical protein